MTGVATTWESDSWKVVVPRDISYSYEDNHLASDWRALSHSVETLFRPPPTVDGMCDSTPVDTRVATMQLNATSGSNFAHLFADFYERVIYNSNTCALSSIWGYVVADQNTGGHGIAGDGTGCTYNQFGTSCPFDDFKLIDQTCGNCQLAPYSHRLWNQSQTGTISDDSTNAYVQFTFTGGDTSASADGWWNPDVNNAGDDYYFTGAANAVPDTNEHDSCTFNFNYNGCLQPGSGGSGGGGGQNQCTVGDPNCIHRQGAPLGVIPAL